MRDIEESQDAEHQCQTDAGQKQPSGIGNRIDQYRDKGTHESLCDRFRRRCRTSDFLPTARRLVLALGAFESRLDPIDRVHTVRWVHAFSRVDFDIGNDRFVLGLVPPGEDPIGGGLNALVAVV